MSKVFISYARDGSCGQNLAEEAQTKLQDTGFDVFRDVSSLGPGDVWAGKLGLEIKTSDVMVIVISEGVRQSDWVFCEFNMAQELNIPIIPVLAEIIFMPLYLRHLQVLNFCDDMNWEYLIRMINQCSSYSSINFQKKSVPLQRR